MLRFFGILFIVVGLFLVTHSPLFAQGMTSVTTDPSQICGIGESDIAVFATKFFGCGVGLIGGVALLFIIYGGFLLALSGGDPSRIRAGREYIMYSIIGMLLAIFALVILNVIGVNILHIPGFNS